jgi:phosphate starvation-inducible PhoH-like protein
MSRKKGKHNRKHQHNDPRVDNDNIIDFHPLTASPPPHVTKPLPIKTFQALNQAQGQFVAAIKKHTLVFGLGPAGTGKSFCTAAMAAEALVNGLVDRIVFTRPAVETGNSMGFLPGRLEEKFDPYFSAFKSCLSSVAGRGVIDCALKNGNIAVEPLAYMRGKTFNRTFVVLDEAQNCTPDEIKMFMTRIGKQSTVVINGDLSQADIGSCSGLADAITRVQHVRGVYIHEFTYADIVRNDIVRDILMCYAEPECVTSRYSSRFGG